MRAAEQIARFMKYTDELELEYQSKREVIEDSFKEELCNIDKFVEDLEILIRRYNRIISTIQELRKYVKKDDPLVSQEMVINQIKEFVDYSKKAIYGMNF